MRRGFEITKVEDEDDFVQYENALEYIDGLPWDPKPNERPRNILIETGKAICVTVWRAAVLGTDDDRYWVDSREESIVKTQVEALSEWQQDNSGKIQFVSVPLFEESAKGMAAYRAVFGRDQSYRKRVGIGNYEAMSSKVDMVRNQMHLQHYVWLYNKHHQPAYTTRIPRPGRIDPFKIELDKVLLDIS